MGGGFFAFVLWFFGACWLPTYEKLVLSLLFNNFCEGALIRWNHVANIFLYFSLFSKAFNTKVLAYKGLVLILTCMWKWVWLWHVIKLIFSFHRIIITVIDVMNSLFLMVFGSTIDRGLYMNKWMACIARTIQMQIESICIDTPFFFSQIVGKHAKLRNNEMKLSISFLLG